MRVKRCQAQTETARVLDEDKLAGLAIDGQSFAAAKGWLDLS